MADQVHCNGVFKGGGAKGVAYVGALEICHDAGIVFDAVAGSSAGAITASLVAAGIPATRLQKLMKAALRTIDRPLFALPRPSRSSLLRNERLGAWLDDVLAGEVWGEPGVGDTARRHCTFLELYEHSKIELFVVAMDLASRQPIVFSHRLTPHMSVTSAVLASSAIPVAFPPVLVRDENEVFRLVDGGAFANYPRFVFDDPSFRQHHGLPEIDDIPTIGFILTDPAIEPVAMSTGPSRDLRSVDAGRFSTDRGSAVRELGPLGAVLTSPILRWSLVVFPLVLVAMISTWVVTEMRQGYPVVGSVPEELDPLEDATLMLLAVTTGAIGLFGIVTMLSLMRLGREVLDVGVMGAVAAMGVGPSVPYWTGTAPGQRHVAVRIPVPSKLRTLSFRPSDSVADDALAAGRAATAAQLQRSFGLDVTAPRPIPGSRVFPGSRWQRMRRWVHTSRSREARIVRRLGVLGRARRTRAWLRSTVIYSTMLGFAALGSVAFSELLQQRVASGVAALAGTAALGLLILYLLAARKHRRSATPFPFLRRRSTGALVTLVALGIASTIVVLTFALASDRASVAAVATADRVPATVRYVLPRSNKALVWVEPVPTLSPAEIDRLRVDHRGTPITRCDQTALQPDLGIRTAVERVNARVATLGAPERCIVLDTDVNGLRVGQRVTILAKVDRGLVLLEGDQWSTEFLVGPISVFIACLLLLGLSYHAGRALRWRHRYERIFSDRSTGPAGRGWVRSPVEAARRRPWRPRSGRRSGRRTRP